MTQSAAAEYSHLKILKIQNEGGGGGGGWPYQIIDNPAGPHKVGPIWNSLFPRRRVGPSISLSAHAGAIPHHHCHFSHSPINLCFAMYSL